MPPQSRSFCQGDFDTAEISRPSGVVEKMDLRKRKICFNLECNQTLPIPHIDDLCEDEIRAVWYQRMEYEKMKSALVPTIRMMMKGEVVEETNQQTTRGLEYRTREGAIRRQHNKLNAISAVLDEQDRQQNENDVNDEQLAQVYRDNNIHCVEAAIALGRADEEAILAYMAEETPEFDETSSVTSSACGEDRKERRSITKMLMKQKKGAQALLSDIKAFALARRPLVGQAA